MCALLSRLASLKLITNPTPNQTLHLPEGGSRISGRSSWNERMEMERMLKSVCRISVLTFLANTFHSYPRIPLFQCTNVVGQRKIARRFTWDTKDFHWEGVKHRKCAFLGIHSEKVHRKHSGIRLCSDILRVRPILRAKSILYPGNAAGNAELSPPLTVAQRQLLTKGRFFLRLSWKKLSPPRTIVKPWAVAH